MELFADTSRDWFGHFFLLRPGGLGPIKLPKQPDNCYTAFDVDPLVQSGYNNGFQHTATYKCRRTIIFTKYLEPDPHLKIILDYDKNHFCANGWITLFTTFRS